MGAAAMLTLLAVVAVATSPVAGGATCSSQAHSCRASPWDDTELSELARGLPDTLQNLTLKMYFTDVGNAGLKVLAEHLPGTLQKLMLDMGITSVGNLGLQTLAEHLPGALRELTLGVGGTHVGDPGLKTLAEHLPRTLRQLTLDMYRTQVGDQGLKDLAGQLPVNLQSLTLVMYGTHVDDAGLKALAEHLPRTLRKLTLNMYRTQVGDQGLQALAGQLPRNLQSLELYTPGTNVGDHGLKALAVRLPGNLQNLELDMGRSLVGNLGLKALAEHLPRSLRELTLDLTSTKLSIDGVRTLCLSFPLGLQTGSLLVDVSTTETQGSHSWGPNKSSDALFSRVVAAARCNLGACVQVLAAGSLDKFERDSAGFSARDLVQSSPHPELALMLTEPSQLETLQHLAHKAEAWLVVALCLGAALVACIVAGRAEATSGIPGRDADAGGALPPGAVSLAAKATYGTAIKTAARLFRLLEVLANLAGITALVHHVRPFISIPFCLALYSLPRLLAEGRRVPDTPLALELAGAQVSLLDVGRWPRHGSRAAAIGAARVGLLLALAAGAAQHQQLLHLVGSHAGSEALRVVGSNHREDYCLEPVGMAAGMRRAGWRPWKLVGEDCDGHVEPDGCLDLGHGWRCDLEASIVTSATSSVQGETYVRPPGSDYTSNRDVLRGSVPFGRQTLACYEHRGCRVCPEENLCVRGPRVAALWQALRWLCFTAAAAWCCLTAALAALSRASPSWRCRLRTAAAPSAVAELACEICAAQSAAAVSELPGAAAAVEPLRAIRLFPPGGLYLAILFLITDVGLDLCTITAMIGQQEVWWAGLIAGALLTSTMSEVVGHRFKTLALEVMESVRVGVLARGLQAIRDQEASSEALISLFISSYALPWTMKSPLWAAVCVLSVLFSACTLCEFMHEVIDLRGSIELADEEAKGGAEMQHQLGTKAADCLTVVTVGGVVLSD